MVRVTVPGSIQGLATNQETVLAWGIFYPKGSKQEYSIYFWSPNTYKVPTIMVLGPFGYDRAAGSGGLKLCCLLGLLCDGRPLAGSWFDTQV